MGDNHDGSVLESVKETICSKIQDAIPKSTFDNYQVNSLCEDVYRYIIFFDDISCYPSDLLHICVNLLFLASYLR